MMRHIMKMPRGFLNIILALLAITVILVLGILIYTQSQPKVVSPPPDFLSAQEAAAEVSRQIVELTASTNEKIKVVNLSDLGGNPYQALSLIQEAREMNAVAQEHAFSLARLLQRMAESLGSIKSRKTQRLAYEAVAVELSLVSEFISYTQDLSKFLEALSRAIISGLDSDRQAVERSLKEVNARVTKINAINKEFLTKMGEFDSPL